MTPTTSRGFRPNFENEILRLGVARNVCVCVWRNMPTVLEIRELEKAGKRLALEHKRGTGLYNIILGGTPAFPQDVRDEVGRITRDDTIYTLAAAHVVLVSGLTGAAVRAFLSTVFLLSRPNTPNKVFADVPHATRWVHQQLEKGSVIWTESELTEFATNVIGEVRSPSG